LLGRKENNSRYKSKGNFKTSEDYLEYMYGDTNGFIARMVLSGDGKHTQKLFRANRLISDNTYDGLGEVYTSMNSFMTGKSRKTKNLKRLNALFVDIDCYNMNLTPEQVIYQLENDYFGAVIPRPTFIIRSGRGLYLQWKIYKGDDRRAMPKWSKIQRYLYSRLKELGADEQSLDAARILRVPYTVNTKSKNLVEIADFADVQYTLYEIIKEYDIRGGENFKQSWGEATERQKECAADIAREQDIELPDFTDYESTFEFIGKFGRCRFKRDTRATEKQIKYAKKIGERKGLDLPDFGDYEATWDFIAANRNKPFDGNSYLNMWCEDIERLIKSRRGENCRRELSLFLYRLWLCEATGDYELALQKTLELNAKLDQPFSESYVRSNTYSAEAIVKQGATYKYKKNSIIELLKITDDEMKQLEYLTYMAARERKQNKNRKSYEKRLREAEKQTKKEEIKIRRANMAKMINEGKTKDEICGALKISQSTYYADRTTIETEGLVACAKKAVRAGKAMGNKITAVIASAIQETVDTLKELAGRHKMKADSDYAAGKKGVKKPKNETDKEVFQKIQPYYCIWTT
jgi:DNA-binding CsgD family transcriptional regulator